MQTTMTMFESSRLTSLTAKGANALNGDDRRALSALQVKAERLQWPVFRALRALFGDSVDRIACDLPDCWLTEEVGGAYLCIGEGGLLQTICGGGRVVAMIPTAADACRIKFALVVDTQAHDDWCRANARNDHDGAVTSRQLGPCPHEVLRLVAST